MPAGSDEPIGIDQTAMLVGPLLAGFLLLVGPGWMLGCLTALSLLAAVLVQFPSSFQADPDTRGYLDWLLDALQAYPLAVELRHRSWSDDAEGTSALLEKG